MMSRDAAMAYGRKTGCRYYVYNSLGGLLGGFRDKGSAEKCADEWARKYAKDRLNSDVTVTIKEEG